MLYNIKLYIKIKVIIITINNKVKFYKFQSKNIGWNFDNY